LTHNSSPFCSGYFGDGVLQISCPGWPQTSILPISSSQIARIIGVSHQYLTCPCILEICWFAELIMFDTFLLLICLSLLLLFFPELSLLFRSFFFLPLSIFCHAGPVIMICFIFVHHGGWLFLFWFWRSTLMDTGFLVGSYFVSGLEIYQSMLSWPLGFLLRSLLSF
jgi:hypothetical protein